MPAKRQLIMMPAERGHRHELQPAKIVLADRRDGEQILRFSRCSTSISNVPLNRVK